MNNLKKEEFKNINVLIIGDTCVDRFVYGTAVRLAPEAPIPVFNPINSIDNDGMAGNVVANLKALGINTHFIYNPENIIKTRYVDDRSGQILLRVDENDKCDHISHSVLENIKWEKYDAVVISDYCKGLLHEDDIEYISLKHPLTFLDSKKILDDWASNISFIKINHVEYEHTKYNLKDLNIKNKLIITLSNKGCQYKDKIFPVKKVQIKDVSGAGDTFLSGLVAEYILTKDIEKAILFAQACATIVVQKPGVATI
jgi:D-beta-D-heptose 7-phosphate kinase/D-beta-D-heptose 1-phosphate adenosyltransferase